MINYKDKQAGGTFLGIIIGLIIGLVIAVVVALMITKTPVPFIDRGAKIKPAESTSGKMADPNTSLYGNKEAAKDAAKDLAKEPAPVPPAAQMDNKPVGKEDAKAPVVEKSATENSKVAAAKPDSLEDKVTYFLQVGAFREQADAESTKAKLALQGFEAQISERPSESGVLYRVRVGPFNQIEAMNKVRSKLSDGGVDVAVVRIPK